MQIAARKVSRPLQSPPAGACDSHAHVFGPFDRFPLNPARKYTPPLATVDNYLAMLDRVGTSHGVLVHPSASGWDLSCTMNALEVARGRLRAVVVVPQDVSDEALRDMDGAGVRGIRFTEIGDRSATAPQEGVLRFEDFAHFSSRLRQLNWHAQLWASCDNFVTAAPALLRYDIPLVVDHMGFFDAARGVNDRAFQEFLGLLRHENIWVKLTLCRISKQYPACEDARPFHDALLRAAPERMLWGSDWPYINLDPSPPDAGAMLDAFDSFVQDEGLRDQVLVKNGERLYGF